MNKSKAKNCDGCYVLDGRACSRVNNSWWKIKGLLESNMSQGKKIFKTIEGDRKRIQVCDIILNIMWC